MKKVFLCAILASLSYPAIASSLQDQLSAVAEAEQQGKNEERQRQQRIRKLVRINWTPKPLRTKNAIKVMKMSYVA